MKKVFLDTNVVIDFLAARPNFVEDAAKIMTLAYKGQISIYASAITFSTASYVMGRHHANSDEDIRLTVADFIKTCNVTVVDGKSVKYATLGEFDDFEDAMQYESAVSANCDLIVTRNLDDFTNSKLPVILPGEFLSDFVLQWARSKDRIDINDKNKDKA